MFNVDNNLFVNTYINKLHVEEVMGHLRPPVSDLGRVSDELVRIGRKTE